MTRSCRPCTRMTACRRWVTNVGKVPFGNQPVGVFVWVLLQPRTVTRCHRQSCCWWHLCCQSPWLNEAVFELDVPCFVLQHPYRLHAVLVHEGQAASGHYWAYVFNAQMEKWLKFNDITVTETQWEEIERESVGGFHNTSAYCLMYVDGSKVDMFDGRYWVWKVLPQSALDLPSCENRYLLWQKMNWALASWSSCHWICRSLCKRTMIDLSRRSRTGMQKCWENACSLAQILTFRSLASQLDLVRWETECSSCLFTSVRHR